MLQLLLTDFTAKYHLTHWSFSEVLNIFSEHWIGRELIETGNYFTEYFKKYILYSFISHSLQCTPCHI